MTNREPTVVGGRYELGELLGRGGMAEVRKGVDQRLGRAVAVKRLRTDLASDSTFQARFRREAQSSASLNHPSIVAVYDTGQEWSDTDGPGGEGVAQPYIVMEFVAGRTLREILREGRKILPERALELTSGVLAALDYSHRAGIIHRDIKPGNVMLTPSGDVKVMDFGIARAVSDASSSMTQTAAVVGTAQYLSPEQARGETVDSRSDVYSTGCLLYELLTGRPPFVGDSPVAVAYQHVREPAQPPSDFDTEITPEMDAIVMKALAKRVEDRYQSAAAMRSDIERYLSGRPVQAPVLPTSMTAMLPTGPLDDDHPTAVGGTAVPAARPYDDDEDDDRPAGRAGVYFLVGFLIVALIGAGVFLLPKLFESEPTNNNRVPDLIGMTEAAARSAVADAGLIVGDVSYEPDEDAEKDQVVSQDPNPDEFVEDDTEVDFVVSSGKPMVSVPSVVGQNREQARAALVAAGLKVSLQERDADEPLGQVLETDPAAGANVPEGSEVTVFFSDGPEQVPDVVGLTQSQAERALREAGFEVFVTSTSDTTEPKGTVVRQNPPAGSDEPEGTSITIEVSTFEEPTETPTPTPTDPGTPTPTVPTSSPSTPPTEG
jgi:eukaryotic-like serine/threonine-protein kinase